MHRPFCKGCRQRRRAAIPKVASALSRKFQESPGTALRSGPFPFPSMRGIGSVNLIIAVLVLLCLGAPASAVPTPVGDLHRSTRSAHDGGLPSSAAREDADVNIEPAGALLERDYFQAPPAFSSGVIPCRFEPNIFEKVRLAQSCR